MVAIDVDRFMPLDLFFENVEKFKEYVKSLPKMSEESKIWIPGEKEWLTMETRKKIGIPIHKNILKEIKDEGEKAGVEFKVKVLKETA
jgi:LDH2 family malate/lactate/ureidoglycolate dehydrogenase